MDIIAELMTARANVMGEIQDLAQSGDSQGVLATGHRLEEIENFLHRGKELVKEVETFLRRGELAEPPISIAGQMPSPSITHLDSMSPRQRGAAGRDAFVKRVAAAGLVLRKQKGTIYLKPSGERVGIAYASEQRIDRWFLGLKEGAFDSAVLLCEDGGRLRELWVSQSVLSKYGRALSRSGGDMKFNVTRSGPRLTLIVPGEGQVAVDELRGEYNILKEGENETED